MSSFTAFHGKRLLARGSAVEVALAAKALLEEHPGADVLIFDDQSGRQIDFNLAGSDRDVAARLTPKKEEDVQAKRAPGRPRLGVVAREVTLLPRQWDWLNAQPGGASAALRKLVDAARAANAPHDKTRRAKTATDTFMMAMLGDQPGYEDAARALYAGDEQSFRRRIGSWPADLRTHVERLAAAAFES
ncbi:DUF2239 family protein [Nitratireductor sp. GISD-1A_MAKvit]|uniref:DUF2239 family protein n=1 Tax=Nitratireductor sp. GISD-1A_MAKvit TaxID=3234198 RepID=UPI0034650DE3